jgi:hypothetical protein
LRGTITPSFIELDALNTTSSSAYHLDKLRFELLHLVFQLLDFSKSLYPVARQSPLPAYRHTVTLAPNTLAAITRTKLLSTHSAALIYAALCSEAPLAVFATGTGHFFFLLTAARCCLTYLRDNPAMRVTSITRAALCFGLTRKHLADMRNLPRDRTTGSSVSKV